MDQLFSVGLCCARHAGGSWPQRVRGTRLSAVPPAHNWPVDQTATGSTATPDAASIRVGDPRLVEIRRQILAGIYLTSDKLEAVADRLAVVIKHGFVGSGRIPA